MYSNKRASLFPPYMRNPSIHSEDLESQFTLQAKQRNFAMANTYKMEPDDDSVFIEGMVKKNVEEFLSKKVGDMVYEGENGKQLCIDLAADIKELIKSFSFRRYKLVSHVTITSSHRQGMQQVSRCIWNENHDRYISCVYRNPTMNVVVVVYAVYFE